MPKSVKSYLDDADAYLKQALRGIDSGDDILTKSSIMGARGSLRMHKEFPKGRER